MLGYVFAKPKSFCFERPRGSFSLCRETKVELRKLQIDIRIYMVYKCQLERKKTGRELVQDTTFGQRYSISK